MPGVTLEDAAIVVAYLGAFRGPRHAQAVASLRTIVERAGSCREGRHARRSFAERRWLAA
jgi:hypothetical protein